MSERAKQLVVMDEPEQVKNAADMEEAVKNADVPEKNNVEEAVEDEIAEAHVQVSEELQVEKADPRKFSGIHGPKGQKRCIPEIVSADGQVLKKCYGRYIALPFDSHLDISTFMGNLFDTQRKVLTDCLH